MTRSLIDLERYLRQLQESGRLPALAQLRVPLRPQRR